MPKKSEIKVLLNEKDAQRQVSKIMFDRNQMVDEINSAVRLGQITFDDGEALKKKFDKKWVSMAGTIGSKKSIGDIKGYYMGQAKVRFDKMNSSAKNMAKGIRKGAKTLKGMW